MLMTAYSVHVTEKIKPRKFVNIFLPTLISFADSDSLLHSSFNANPSAVSSHQPGKHTTVKTKSMYSRQSHTGVEHINSRTTNLNVFVMLWSSGLFSPTASSTKVWDSCCEKL